jgi:hypothetical protein
VVRNGATFSSERQYWTKNLSKPKSNHGTSELNWSYRMSRMEITNGIGQVQPDVPR